jgi:serine/threonine protein kinase
MTGYHTMHGPAADRNLLFGILALQMDFVRQDALISAMSAWALAKTKSLGQILLDQKCLSQEQHDKLAALVQERINQHEKESREPVDPDATAPYRPSPSPLRYHILRGHRQGGLGEVFVAHDEELNREVALKQIKDQYADLAESRTRFVFEAEVTGGLEHPGVVPVYGLGTYSDGRPFYAMRFIRGETLREAIKRFHDAEGPFRDPGERAIALRALLARFLDVCNAIAYAHSRGVLHRDLKPANVMLGPYGDTLVVDWGLAKVLDSPDLPVDPAQGPLRPASGTAPTRTRMGAEIGSPSYRAPEQAHGWLHRMDVRTDVYGLGAILFEILTNQPPHPDGVRTVEPPRARAVQPLVPLPLEEIAAKALSPEPADRYPSALALAEEIQRWLAEEPIAAYRGFVAEFERMVQERPGVPDYREQLARNQTNLGLILSGMGRLAEGLQAFRAAVGECERLVEAYPGVTRYRADLATNRIHLSRVLLGLNQPEEAEQAQRAAISEYDRLMQANPHEYRTNVPDIMLTLMPDADLRRHGSESTPPAEPLAEVTPVSEYGEGLATPIPAHEGPQRPVDLPAEMRARLTLRQQYARGGASRVWLAHDEDLNRQVIVKELHPSMADTPEARKRFLKEAQITAQLEHPNIVPVYGLGYRSQDDVPYVIMRFINGRTLKDAIHRYHEGKRAGQSDAQELRRLLMAFVSACRGVAYAHSRGVLHRDPKPANIILGEDGNVVVVD